MKLPFSPGIIHPNLFPEHSHPMQVNFGDCFKWAWCAYKLFNDVELYSQECHAFIKYRGKFYDSESLEGVKKYSRLRTIKDHIGMFPAPVKMEPQEFINYWSSENKCDWNKLNENINALGRLLVPKGKNFG